MSRGAWRRARGRDLPALEAFLRAREPEAAGFIGRSLREGSLRLPNPFRGAVWLNLPGARHGGGAAKEPDDGPGAAAGAPVRAAGPGPIAGAVLCSTSGAVFPQFGRSRPEGDAALARALQDAAYIPASTVGPAADVLRFEAALGLRALASVRYRLMHRPAGGAPASPEAGRTWPAGLLVRRAIPEDLELLFPLQEGYEREEVLTPIHAFNARASRAGLAAALRDRIVMLALLDGEPVGKAGTNARAFGLDQVGGVYVAPPWRGRGIGLALMQELLSALGQEGRGASLFVKTDNMPALGLYRGLGFRELGDFRADYHQA